jgi:methionine synthase I (cobalamin-dependent)
MLVAGLYQDRTIEAFYYSVEHAMPLAIGINCGMGRERVEKYVERLNRISEYNIIVYPNAVYQINLVGIIIVRIIY